MIYTDGVHLVATTIKELHAFAAQLRIPACWYHGYHKGKPHYDLNSPERVEAAYDAGAVKVTDRQIVQMFQEGKIQKRY